MYFTLWHNKQENTLSDVDTDLCICIHMQTPSERTPTQQSYFPLSILSIFFSDDINQLKGVLFLFSYQPISLSYVITHLATLHKHKIQKKT